MARKTKYNKDVLKKSQDYVEQMRLDKDKLPKAESLALFLEIERKTLYNWAKVNAEFKKLLEKIQAIQLERLIDDGVYGGKRVNPAIIKLLLVNNHKMRSDEGLSIVSKFSNEQVSKIAERIARRNKSNGDTPSTK